VALASKEPKGSPRVARFGIFEADFDSGELRKQGRRVKIQEQPFQLLCLLLDRAGGLVSREELREKLWPAGTFVDFDHGLNSAVNKIREVLGDSASSPRFVETLARRGYRFLGEVEWVSRPALPAETRALPTAHRPSTRLLFALIQAMYVVFYIEALIHWHGVDRISWAATGGPRLLVVVVIAAGIGIPVRSYLLAAIGFDHPLLPEKFRKIFPGLAFLDELWALSPFLLAERIGFGASFAATAALVYVPFAERTLVRLAYGSRP
jgi:cholera toxin transcriptional activator